MRYTSDPSEPRHPIRVVSTRTGVAPTLLRAWERRYGVVEPDRSEGGQRLYSDAHIERLVLLRRVTEAGRSIGQVAGLTLGELRGLVDEDRMAQTPGGSGDARVDAALAAAWNSVAEMDAEGLEADLRRAVVTLGSATFTDQLLSPLLRAIGQKWADGTVRPAHEHVATEVVKRVLHWMVEPTRTEGAGPRMVVGTLSGEMHELGALLAGATASLEGWQVTFLGHDLPPTDVALAARTVSARVVAIGIVNPLAFDGVPDQLRTLLSDLPPGITLLVGGPSAAEVQDAVADARLKAVGSLADFRSLLGELAGT